MAERHPGSFYTLELHVAPGGCRRGDCFVLTDLDVLKRIVTADLSSGNGVYLIAFYGEDIVVGVHVPGKQPRRIDLMPFIDVELPGHPSFVKRGVCNFDFAADEEEHDDEEEDEDEDEDEAEAEDTLVNKLLCDAIKPEVTIDWEAAAIPALPGPVLPAGTAVHIKSSYTGQVRQATFGHNDFEGGDHQGMSYPGLAPARPQKRSIEH